MGTGPSHLFLYGTLVPTLAPSGIAPSVARLGSGWTARVPGRLYDLGTYPAAVPDTSWDGWIHGLVFADPHPDILDALDVYEGFDPQNPGRSLFVREICEAELRPGATVPSWIYAFRGPVGASRLIADGRYTGAAEG